MPQSNNIVVCSDKHGDVSEVLNDTCAADTVKSHIEASADRETPTSDARDASLNGIAPADVHPTGHILRQPEALVLSSSSNVVCEPVVEPLRRSSRSTVATKSIPTERACADERCMHPSDTSMIQCVAAGCEAWVCSHYEPIDCVLISCGSFICLAAVFSRDPRPTGLATRNALRTQVSHNDAHWQERLQESEFVQTRFPLLARRLKMRNLS